MTFFVGPLCAGTFVALIGIHLKTLDPLLTGVSILTGLLFGLLIHVLSLGLAIAHDDRITLENPVIRLSEQLRANVAWACGVGLLLVSVLTAAASLMESDPTRPYPAWLTGVVLAISLHLVGTLLMVMKRVRATYRMLGK